MWPLTSMKALPNHFWNRVFGVKLNQQNSGTLTIVYLYCIKNTINLHSKLDVFLSGSFAYASIFATWHAVWLYAFTWPCSFHNSMFWQTAPRTQFTQLYKVECSRTRLVKVQHYIQHYIVVYTVLSDTKKRWNREKHTLHGWLTIYMSIIYSYM